MNTEKILNYLRRRTAGDEEVAAADVIERQAAQIEMLREALEAGYNGLRWWMDAFPMHVTEADNEEMLKLVKTLSTTPNQALDQFAAIADLSGVIMCEKKPVAYMAVYKDQVMGFIPTQESGTIPVYRAIKELP